jgi:hypothetical protein
LNFQVGATHRGCPALLAARDLPSAFCVTLVILIANKKEEEALSASSSFFLKNDAKRRSYQIN